MQYLKTEIFPNKKHYKVEPELHLIVAKNNHEKYRKINLRLIKILKKIIDKPVI